MRIDPKGTIAGYPALRVRRALRQLDLHVEWDLGRLEAITGEGRAFVKVLSAAGLVEPTRKGLVDHTRGEGLIIRDSRPAREARDGREGSGRVPGLVDLAVEIVPKGSNPERARAINERHVLELELLGPPLSRVAGPRLFWYWETCHYLKGGSRVISLANLKAEGEIVLAGAHQILYAEGAWRPSAPPRTAVVHRRRRESADDTLF